MKWYCFIPRTHVTQSVEKGPTELPKTHHRRHHRAPRAMDIRLHAFSFLNPCSPIPPHACISLGGNRQRLKLVATRVRARAWTDGRFHSCSARFCGYRVRACGVSVIDWVSIYIANPGGRKTFVIVQEAKKGLLLASSRAVLFLTSRSDGPVFV